MKQGERSTSYFLNLENTRQNSNRVDLDSNGNLNIMMRAFLRTAKTSYEKLYESKSAPDAEDAIESYFESFPAGKGLDDIDKIKCEGLLSHEECEKSVHKMKKNKSPGLDGLTAEFYQAFGLLLVSC